MRELDDSFTESVLVAKFGESITFSSFEAVDDGTKNGGVDCSVGQPCED
jgi:hypothetical protein